MVFLIVFIFEKKLSHNLVRDNKFWLCPIFYYLFYPNLRLISKSNKIVQQCHVKSGYEIRYEYDTAPIWRYEKILKIKIRYGLDTLIKKII